MPTQQVIIKERAGRTVTRRQVEIPTDAELSNAAVELKHLGGATQPAASRFGTCIGVYIPAHAYSFTDVDPFTEGRGKPATGGTIREVCMFWFDSGVWIADTWYENDPPPIHYYCEKVACRQEGLFDERAESLEEGAAISFEQSAYERNPWLRELCIRHHGCQCAVCGLNFEELYGRAAAGIIHVHHLTPLSTVGESHRIDPAIDLMPVCPNCHAVIHRNTPPYTLDQVRAMLNR